MRRVDELVVVFLCTCRQCKYIKDLELLFYALTFKTAALNKLIWYHASKMRQKIAAMQTFHIAY